MVLAPSLLGFILSMRSSAVVSPARSSRLTRPLLTTSADAASADDNEPLDMEVLADRLAMMRTRQESESCTLIVWSHALLPRQRLRFRVGPPFVELYQELSQSNGTAVLVGGSPKALLSHAVSVQIESYARYSDGTANVEVRGLRRCALVELQEDHSLQEWTGSTATRVEPEPGASAASHDESTPALLRADRWFMAMVRFDRPSSAPAAGAAPDEELARRAERVSTLVAEWEVRRRPGPGP